MNICEGKLGVWILPSEFSLYWDAESNVKQKHKIKSNPADSSILCQDGKEAGRVSEIRLRECFSLYTGFCYTYYDGGYNFVETHTQM